MGKKELDAKWDKAFDNPGTQIPVGDDVVCDLCSADYTQSADTGGFVFESKGVCPKCAPKFLESVESYGEEKFIRARCPEGKSFADFIREYRGPNAFLRVLS